jgi:hypothetical protein
MPMLTSMILESIKFAWWPVTMTSGKRIWLKTYILHKSLYDESTGRPPLNSLYFEWTETPEEQILRILKGK